MNAPIRQLVATRMPISPPTPIMNERFFQMMSLISSGDEIVRYEEPDNGIYKKLIVHNGKLAGAILLGPARNSFGAS